MFNRSYINAHKGHPHYLIDSQLRLLQKKVWLTDEEHYLQDIFGHLSDPTKLKIYLLLYKVDEIAVTDIMLILGISQSAVSHALSDLKKLGVVEASRCGKLVCYSLKKKKVVDNVMHFLKKKKLI